MSKTTVDQALELLGTAIKSQAAANVNVEHFLQNLPKRSLSGDHINGGKIVNFASTGIADRATKTQITITDQEIAVDNLRVGTVKDNLTVEGNVTAQSMEVAGLLKAGLLQVDEIRADVKLEKFSPLEFKSTSEDTYYGKGIIWTGGKITKQFVMSANPDRLFSTENLDLAKDRHFSINNVIVLNENELGPSVTKSNIKELGRLRGLTVDGDIIVNQYMFYDSTSDRLGLGTDTPHAALSVAEDAIEVVLGTREGSRGMVGTYASLPFDIVTDNRPRISVEQNGDIKLGNTTQAPVQVSVHGKLAIKVKNPDPEVDLHVAGPIRYHGHIHMYGEVAPSAGEYVKGDVVWNTNPQVGSYAGWICTTSGNPGRWAAFGAIVNV